MADIEPTTSAPRVQEAPRQQAAGLPRRSMLKGLAVAGAAVPFLAACGSGNDSSPSGNPGGGATGGSTSGHDPGSSDVITPVSAVKLGGGVIVADKGIVVTQP